MPRVAAYTLIWSVEQNRYELCQPGDERPWPVENEGWLARLGESSSLAFRGRWGHLTLRKETRQHGGEGYWYAYRNHGQKTLKRYAGRTSDLSITRLEEIASALALATGKNADEPVTNRSLRPDSRRTLQPVFSPLPAPDFSDRQLMPLLVPKLSLPRLLADLVARETLLNRLDAGLRGKLTLLCAPAGFGKTTLVAQWLARLGQEREKPVVAWVSLDSGDNDLVRFWRYVITAACQALGDEVDRVALVHLHQLEAAPFEPLALEAPLTLLLNDLSRSSKKGILVLEDYHVIVEPQIHAALAFLLSHLPATWHLVLMTRTEPPLALALLRAVGALSELGAGDLRFSYEEMRTFLTQTLMIAPSPEVVSGLDALVEGWITGLRLFTLACQGSTNARTLEQHLRNFSGQQRHLLDYFLSEVLATQPPEIQRFLLQTSLLNSLTAPLCDAITGRRDSKEVLSELERANLFLSQLAGQERWYRYHPLFVEALRHEALQFLDEWSRQSCYESASVWYEEHAQLSEAIEMALAAQAGERVASLLERITAPQRFHEMHEHYTLQRWLVALPENILQSHPMLCLTLAMVQLFVNDCQQTLSAEVLARTERALRMAEQAWQVEENRSGLAEALAFRVVLARFQGDLSLAARLARQALAWLAKDALQWRATCLSAIAENELLAGDLEVARQTVLEAQHCFGAAGNHYGRRAALLMLAEITLLQGRLRESETLYQEGLDIAGEDLSDRGLALLGLAELAYEWNDLGRAEAQAREALEIGKHSANEKLQIHATCLLVTIQHARGQIEHAHQELAVLLAHVQTQSSPLLYRQVLAHEALLQVRVRQSAPRWLAWQAAHEKPLPVLQQAQEHLLLARLLAGQGKTSEALNLLIAARDKARQQDHTRVELEALLLLALGYRAQQNNERSWSVLQEALALAQPEGYMRLFLDEGEPLAALLRLLPPVNNQKHFPAYLRSLLLAFSQQQAGSGPLATLDEQRILTASEPLSPQEQHVLRLLAEGFSNREIARTLVVSPNTIKTQVQSIYRKLNVHSRQEARQVIREQRLA